MGIIILPSTLDGGFTLICSSCGITEGDISQADYEVNHYYYDDWVCPECKDFIKERHTKRWGW